MSNVFLKVNGFLVRESATRSCQYISRRVSSAMINEYRASTGDNGYISQDYLPNVKVNIDKKATDRVNEIMARGNVPLMWIAANAYKVDIKYTPYGVQCLRSEADMAFIASDLEKSVSFRDITKHGGRMVGVSVSRRANLFDLEVDATVYHIEEITMEKCDEILTTRPEDLRMATLEMTPEGEFIRSIPKVRREGTAYTPSDADRQVDLISGKRVEEEAVPELIQVETKTTGELLNKAIKEDMKKVDIFTVLRDKVPEGTDEFVPMYSIGEVRELIEFIQSFARDMR